LVVLGMVELTTAMVCVLRMILFYICADANMLRI